MPDEQTTPEQGGAQSEEAPATDSSSEASIGRRKPSSGRSAGWWAIRVMLVVLAVIIGGVIYLIDITVHPDSGPEGFRVRRVASTASKHLSSSPDVISAETTDASADLGGNDVRLDVRLKDNTSAEAAANLLAGLPGVFRTVLVFLLQAAFFRSRKSRSTSLGARYPRAE